jgi:Protein ChrB, N-terminal
VDFVAAWLLMAHKVPREPTAHRVGVWRKLKRLGAVLVHDSVWVLPGNSRTREHFRWLAAEVEEAGGGVLIWESTTLVHGSEDALRKHFIDQVEPGYAEILGALKRQAADLDALTRRYRRLKDQDYFDSASGHRVREALLAAKGARRK